MGSIAVIRVDSRLIHGQVAVKWSKIAQASKIIVVDDESASNDITKMILKAAAPANTKVFVYTVEKAFNKWEENLFGDGNVMLVFKTIDSCYRSYKTGLPMPKIQLGNCPKKDGFKALGNEVYASEKDVCKLKEMSDNGSEITIQTIPDVPPISFEKALTKI